VTVARFNQVNIVVGDMGAMSEFYRRLGVKLHGGTAEWAPHHRKNDASEAIGFDLDSQQFASVWNQGWPGGPGIVLGFRLPDRASVDRMFDELTAAGYQEQQKPYEAFWGSRYAVICDPDGNAVGLMSPPEDGRRTLQPPPSA
jgi:catechol 2,3-dioxygenase-like lactoylglutathione lyase family enzyme